ncbi:hypothetical protein KIW74_gp52 [Mycobacterium phage Kimona]|uniref:Uncharacterized protein n=1 Tax=Mycobacterium phage Kimona TaxID=2024295 RepID=A0A249XVC8_9CAUD|nr:hypothetical protein KIW74_gp52 [Mycobacterium phage Kimona]ASZ75476.1 hypothetical protein PBI_KIMONA_40 [Mycobacterium phage Kimona]
MKWGGGEGSSPSIAALRLPTTEVEVFVRLPYMPMVSDGGKGDVLQVKQVATGVEEMSEPERDWAINHLIDNVTKQIREALAQKGYIRGSQ